MRGFLFENYQLLSFRISFDEIAPFGLPLAFKLYFIFLKPKNVKFLVSSAKSNDISRIVRLLSIILILVQITELEKVVFKTTASVFNARNITLNVDAASGIAGFLGL